jgi:hypothetical protein
MARLWSMVIYQRIVSRKSGRGKRGNYRFGESPKSKNYKSKCEKEKGLVR